MRPATLSRRELLGAGAAAGTVLVVGFRWAAPAHGQSAPQTSTVSPFDSWIRIDQAGIVTLTVAKSELGQGVFTTLPMILAEELDADWRSVRIEQAVTDPSRYNHATGDSMSVRTSFVPLRRAAAAARRMLVEAAAERWGVAATACSVAAGVVAGPGGVRLPFGDLAAAAARRPVPDLAAIPLKDPRTFTLLGTSTPRADVPAKVDGSAVFGLDVRVPGMLFAAIARCPVYGGTLGSFDAERARSLPGVKAVLPVPAIGRGAFTRPGVAVVAETSWHALRAREALAIEWQPGANAAVSSAELGRQLERLVAVEGKPVRDDGDAPALLASAARRLEARYEIPFQAHVPMEPPNATVSVRDGTVEAWLAHQGAPWLQAILGGVSGVPPDKVRVHTTFSGGGFGRRHHTDFAVEAALVSRMIGAPVQVVWTREDDIRNDFLRQTSHHALSAALGRRGRPTAWRHRIASTSVETFWAEPGKTQPELSEVYGALEMPYEIPAVRVEYTAAAANIPVMWWRSIAHSANAFAVECFIDELATAARQDPVAFRLALLERPRTLRSPFNGGFVIDTGRLRRVLQLAATRAGWGAHLPAGRGRGVAVHACFHSYIAQVAEVSVASGRIRVDRLTAVVDCGRVLHPDNTAAQVEGAVAFGLTATLKGEITLAAGRVEQRNFDDYDVVRIDEMPEVAVHFVANDLPPTGIGEVGVPPVAPAVANAVHAATGRRVRRLPIRLDTDTAHGGA